MKRRAWLVLSFVVVVAGLGAVPHSVDAFYVATRTIADGGGMQSPEWPTAAPVEFRIAMDTVDLALTDGSEVPAVEAAFATVGAVMCSNLHFTAGARVPHATLDPMHWMIPMSGNYILVYWSSDPAIWGMSRSVGRFDFAHDGAGNMIGATIVLNSGDHSWSTTGEAGKIDVQGTVTALIVRSLGLTSTMPGNASYPVYTPGDTSKRMLGTDDVAGVTYLYGDGTAGCGMTAPEGMCMSGDPTCPPTPVVDAGMGTRPDSGVGPRPDAGAPTPDGGMMTMTPADDGGCSCRVASASVHGSSSAWGLASLVGLAAVIAVRARRRRTGTRR